MLLEGLFSAAYFMTPVQLLLAAETKAGAGKENLRLLID
jgi:hypothetical protein